MSFSTPPRLSPYGKLARSSSTRSTETSIEMREWIPTQPVPLIGVEGNTGRGGALVNNTVGRAEKNLSSLFVENERKVTPERTKRPKGWGGSLVNGAMNAGVFGAALGLTAYRFWSGDEPRSPTSTISPSISATSSASMSASSSAGPSTLRSRPDSVELPPPPAYTESDAMTKASIPPVQEDEEVWEDEEPRSLTHKRSSSRITPPRPSRHRKALSRSRFTKIPTRSVASITVEDPQPPMHEPPDHRIVPNTTSDAEDDDEGVIDPVEVLRRLDDVSSSLMTMIAEGRRALAAPSPVVITEGWHDEHSTSPQSPTRTSATSLPRESLRSSRKKAAMRSQGFPSGS